MSVTQILNNKEPNGAVEELPLWCYFSSYSWTCFKCLYCFVMVEVIEQTKSVPKITKKKEQRRHQNNVIDVVLVSRSSHPLTNVLSNYCSVLKNFGNFTEKQLQQRRYFRRAFSQKLFHRVPLGDCFRVSTNFETNFGKNFR